jgi:hypothetical protein
MSVQSQPSGEPPHRQGDGKEGSMPRSEKVRMIALCLALLALLAGFLYYLLSKATLPLFAAMVVAFLSYQRLDAWLDLKDV